MKKAVLFFALMIILALSLPLSVQGAVYEYSMEEEEMGAVLTELEGALPKDVKKELPENPADGREYSFAYFWDKMVTAVKGAFSPFLKMTAALISMVIISALFSSLAESTESSFSRLYSALCTICVALCAYEGLKGVFSSVSTMLSILSDTMAVMIGAMETLYIAGGNITSAAVFATATELMIGFTEAVFSSVLSPATHICFVLSVTAAVTENGGVGYMAKALRGLVTGVLVAVMAMLCFSLSLQVALSAAGDTLAARAVKFALGSYIPIVGGSVSEAFSYMAKGISVIKQSCGALGIVAIFLSLLYPFASLLSGRIALGLSGAVAGMLGRGREAALLEECKGITTLLIAVSAGAAAMYIIALGIFCRASVAVA